MKKLLVLLVFGISLVANDIIIKESKCSVDKTAQNIQVALESRGVQIFAVIDHKKNANSVNMIMPDSKVLIFGNPKVGTTFMLTEMKAGLDLPLKILVYQDKDSKTKIAYRDGTWLSKEHNLAISLREDKVNKALNKITDKAQLCQEE